MPGEKTQGASPELTPEIIAELRRRALPQHLISASEALYRHELLCAEQGVPFPAALRRAWKAIRAEVRRLQAEETPPSGQGKCRRPTKK